MEIQGFHGLAILSLTLGVTLSCFADYACLVALDSQRVLRLSKNPAENPCKLRRSAIVSDASQRCPLRIPRHPQWLFDSREARCAIEAFLRFGDAQHR